VSSREEPRPPDDSAVEQRILALLESGTPTKTIASELSAWCGLPRRELYARVQAAKARLSE
jgi:hypothetical protein